MRKSVSRQNIYTEIYYNKKKKPDWLRRDVFVDNKNELEVENSSLIFIFPFASSSSSLVAVVVLCSSSTTHFFHFVLFLIHKFFLNALLLLLLNMFYFFFLFFLSDFLLLFIKISLFLECVYWNRVFVLFIDRVFCLYIVSLSLFLPFLFSVLGISFFVC